MITLSEKLQLQNLILTSISLTLALVNYFYTHISINP